MAPLCQRMIEDMQVRNLTLYTQRAFLRYVSQFACYFRKSPDLLGPAEIRAFPLYLTRDRRLAPSSVGVAVAAIRSLNNGQVRFTWKDYRQDGQTKVMTLFIDEFIRRFLQHTVPAFLPTRHRKGSAAVAFEATRRLSACSHLALRTTKPPKHREIPSITIRPSER